jgi:hypothetical protein
MKRWHRHCFPRSLLSASSKEKPERAPSHDGSARIGRDAHARRNRRRPIHSAKRRPQLHVFIVFLCTSTAMQRGTTRGTWARQPPSRRAERRALDVRIHHRTPHDERATRTTATAPARSARSTHGAVVGSRRVDGRRHDTPLVRTNTSAGDENDDVRSLPR